MTFTEFLVKRRIDEAAFAAGDAGRYAQWQTLYAQMHPNSFYNSVKMVLNDVRRRFHLALVPAEAVAAPAKPRPVIRRAPSATPVADIADQAPVSRQPTEIVAQQSAPVTAEKKTEEAPLETASKPAKPRPVFKRPAPTLENTQVPASEEKPESPPEAPAPRPRPVFKRPSATNTASDQSTEEKTSEPKVDSPTTDAPKPARPRPVFKRPSPEPEITSGEEGSQEPVLASNPESSPKMETEPPAAIPSPDVKPATPRPRPVFKRPSAEVKEAEGALESTSTKESGLYPKESVNVEATPAAKPPRPRPVFKQPSPSSETEKEGTDASSFSVQNPENKPKTEETRTEEPKHEEEPPAKPPRPRPVFKRPTPPAE